MSKLDLLSMSMRNLWRRKLRTSLTLLGVLIGTTSIIVMISLGLGLNRSTMQSMERMGSLTTINVNSAAMFGKSFGNNSGGPNNTNTNAFLNDQALADFRNIPYVVAAEPLLRAKFGGEMKIGKYTFWPQYVGVNSSYFEAFDLTATEGVAPHLKSKTRPQIYLPSNMGMFLMEPVGNGGFMSTGENIDLDFLKQRMQLNFDSYDSVSGRSKTVKSFRLNQVGLYKNTGWESNIYFLMDDMVYLNKEHEKVMAYNNDGQNSSNQNGNAQNNTRNKDIYDEIRVKVSDVSKVAEVKAQIEAMGYYGNSMMDMVNEMNKQMATIQAVLAGIGSVALLVAAIGITNTMVMSIYERTREIGVMKVIGASVRSIRQIFLTEAIMIGAIGGALGVGLSLLISKLINSLLGPQMSAVSGMGMAADGPPPDISYIPLWLIVLAVVFSGFIGLLSGYFPAKRATKLSAIEAIKTE